MIEAKTTTEEVMATADEVIEKIAKKAKVSVSDEVIKLRENFANQLERCSKAIEQGEAQIKMLKAQLEQVKGALYALDSLSSIIHNPKKEG